ncbi:MAG: adenylate/guanylate cyclase domain-containing protein [Spirulinaceae cyanobacterium RM2_2_10]|nr:adenylate/guanylate cyclase domain-containing protein [Spirulinaceae cyanobacterium RM2_2_10]
MDTKPMQRDRQQELLVDIFVARASVELERQLAAEALQTSEARNQAILRAIPDLMFRVRSDGIYLGYVKTRDFTDLLPEDYEPIGRHIREFLPPALALRHLQHLKIALVTGVPQLYEQEVQLENRIQHEEVRVVVSGPDEALFIVRDVSDRKHAEIALRIAQQQSESLLLNILPRPIAERLKKQPGVIAEQFDEATILFADIVGFTPLAALMTPIEVVNLLNQVFSEFDRLAEQFQIEKIKTIGDAYMAVSGVPTFQFNHAIAAAEMALAMQAVLPQVSTPRLRELCGDQPLQMRVGIHTGSVVAGVIGAKKFIYDLWGDAVNIASRMESQGLPGHIQITEATYEKLSGCFRCERRGEVAVRGRGAIATYWLLPDDQ